MTLTLVQSVVNDGPRLVADLRPSLLLVDPSRDLSADVFSRIHREFDVTLVHTRDSALVHLSRDVFAVVLIIQRTPGLEGTELFNRARRSVPETQWVWVAGYPDLDMLADELTPFPRPTHSDSPWDWQRLLILLKEAVRAYDVECQRSASAAVH